MLHDLAVVGRVTLMAACCLLPVRPLAAAAAQPKVLTYDGYPDRVCNEVAGLTISIWYREDRRVELEPIGPRERLQPGEVSKFTAEWYLLPYEFSPDGRDVDLKLLEARVKGTFAETAPRQGK